MTGPDLERLLAEDAWLRRLARSLAGDAATADDLVQETWAAAIAAGSPPRAARPWLAGTLRNLWRSLARGEGRRTARERDAAPREPASPTDEVVAELVLRREVVDALLALEEPERGVLFRRFFKGATLERIAREDGVAVSTVHARLERGLARMRARFDAAHGGRHAWMIGLLRAARLAPVGPGGGPLRRGDAPSASGAGAAQATLLGGALVMTTMIKAAAVVAAVVPEWSTRTDEKGRLRFDDVIGGEHTSLSVPWGLHSGATVTPPVHDDLSCELQVVLSDPNAADRAHVLDAEGNALQILEHHGTFTMVPEAVRIVAGRSAVVSVSELAHEIVLEKDGAEVVRLPLRVDPDRRSTVEY